jgi:hypothetical protein
MTKLIAAAQAGFAFFIFLSGSLLFGAALIISLLR